MNPPYGTSSTFTAEKQKVDGLAETSVVGRMREDKMDLACRNLFAQFIYRIMMIKEKYNLTNCHIALFCKPSFINSPTYKNFRNKFFKEFKFKEGIFFKASEFADVSSKWGITFNIWSCGETDNQSELLHTAVYNTDGEIVANGQKTIYNSDNSVNTSEWIREIEISKNKVDMPVMKSGINLFENKKNKSIGQLTEDAIGCYYHIASDVYHSATYVALFTGNCSHPSGKWSITKSNFDRIMPTFAARKIVTETWENSADVFLAPNTEHENYQEFVNDSIVYSLFSAFSQQSSLRQVEYKGKLWDIKNEFFWMSREEMMSLANESGNDDCYQDAHVSSDRYVYNLLQGITLSDEAQAVLGKACEIVRKTFKYRKLFNEEHENYQINNWDCGWYQIKALAKEYAKDDLEEFKALYKKLADKMLPMVYEVGFLRK